MAMRKLWILVLGGPALIFGHALQGRTENRTLETHEAMVHWINPAMLAISDTVETSRNSAGDFAPTSIEQTSWSKLESAAHSLEFSSRRMAQAKVLQVGNHTAEVPGFADKSEIQAKLDADPARFRALSRGMADRAARLRSAARAHDPKYILDLVSELNTSCQTCHTLYWEKPRFHD